MNIEEIKSNLCYWDSRNPNSTGEEYIETEEDVKCHCGNCFYGRTQLAEELIKLTNLYQIP